VTAPVLIVSVLLGAAGGALAAWIADTVLAARDDAPAAAPRWVPAASATVGAIVFPLAVWVAGSGWLVPAFVGFALLTLTLAITDLRAQLIPDRINLRGSLGCMVLLGLGAFAAGEQAALARAGVGALLAAAFSVVLYVVGRGRSFGFGDVKLAPVLGLFTAFESWQAFGVGIFAGILVGGVVALVLVVARLRAAQDHFAFGPALIAGSWIGLTLGDRIATWYLG
jgi:leader peptidase (prepilin peptidase) / N-methyltransferase